MLIPNNTFLFIFLPFDKPQPLFGLRPCIIRVIYFSLIFSCFPNFLIR
jgi:hypothetical protein